MKKLRFQIAWNIWDLDEEWDKKKSTKEKVQIDTGRIIWRLDTKLSKNSLSKIPTDDEVIWNRWRRKKFVRDEMTSEQRVS